MTSLLEMLDINTGLALGVAVLSLLWWFSVRRPAGAPPGPWLAVPLLGHLLLLMKKDTRQQFAAWRRQYGDVFSLYLGSQLLVVLNGYKVLKEALVNNADVFSDRPFASFENIITDSKGVFDTSGPVWKAQRKVSTQILRELGMGKNVLAAKIEEEVKEYIRVISESQGQPLDLAHLTQASVSNNICSIVLGKRFEYDDDVFGNILRLMDAIINDAGAGAVVSSMPFLRHLPGDFFKANRFVDNMRLALQKFIKPFVDEHNSRFEEGSYDDFIGAYIREIHHHRNSQSGSPHINDVNLLKLVFDILIAGSETTSTAILWALVYFLHHPDVQDKCYEEIHRVVGTERAPTMQDRPQLVYMEAVIMEVLRYGNVVPLNVVHSTPCDVEFGGYTIPKGTVVIPNLDSVMRDPETWGDPDRFRPERFIGEDGKLWRPEELIPFSMGRRICLGETMARMELLLYISTMVQHFRFLPPETGELPSLQGLLGATYSPKHFKVRSVPRKCLKKETSE
ncbi:cytochrome P450 2U1-like isoform X1 [Pomacea canaliculata]|uniref:cytochrome P450 2U1-like isoform X1 n=1 Tax=Pomacea canaliculata TaxID=400727 RepID=UPI000D73F3A5|nr:cytochrome P450 2U1-like isoform X1 [Pomacea canaliculata]XP_025097336.1 cytochrome P450 2U1-like isoform X1 [Pomacea canaliculata]XP_025097337.1 cytochrome P450 2U1-like isoform X1 [Pomacea canaliculata]